MMRKTLITTALTLATLLSHAAQANDEPLRIGVDIPYAPYQHKLSDGTITGFEVELVNAACEQLQRRCEWVEQAWEGIIPALLARKYDLIASSMNITDERARQVLFSKPYFQVPSVWVGQEESRWNPSENDLAGAAIGVQQGTIQDEFVTQFYPQADIRRYGDSGAVVNDMKSQRLDLVFTAFPLAQETLLDDPHFIRIGELVTGPESIYGPGIGAAFRQRDTALVEEFNAAMKKVRESGTYAVLHEKYFGE